MPEKTAQKEDRITNILMLGIDPSKYPDPLADAAGIDVLLRQFFLPQPDINPKYYDFSFLNTSPLINALWDEDGKAHQTKIWWTPKRNDLTETNLPPNNVSLDTIMVVFQAMEPHRQEGVLKKAEKILQAARKLYPSAKLVLVAHEFTSEGTMEIHPSKAKQISSPLKGDVPDHYYREINSACWDEVQAFFKNPAFAEKPVEQKVEDPLKTSTTRIMSNHIKNICQNYCDALGSPMASNFMSRLEMCGTDDTVQSTLEKIEKLYGEKNRNLFSRFYATLTIYEERIENLRSLMEQHIENMEEETLKQLSSLPTLRNKSQSEQLATDLLSEAANNNPEIAFVLDDIAIIEQSLKHQIQKLQSTLLKFQFHNFLENFLIPSPEQLESFLRSAFTLPPDTTLSDSVKKELFAYKVAYTDCEDKMTQSHNTPGKSAARTELLRSYASTIQKIFSTDTVIQKSGNKHTWKAENTTITHLTPADFSETCFKKFDKYGTQKLLEVINRHQFVTSPDKVGSMHPNSIKDLKDAVYQVATTTVSEKYDFITEQFLADAHRGVQLMGCVPEGNPEQQSMLNAKYLNDFLHKAGIPYKFHPSFKLFIGTLSTQSALHGFIHKELIRALTIQDQWFFTLRGNGGTTYIRIEENTLKFEAFALHRAGLNDGTNGIQRCLNTLALTTIKLNIPYMMEEDRIHFSYEKPEITMTIVDDKEEATVFMAQEMIKPTHPAIVEPLYNKEKRYVERILTFLDLNDGTAPSWIEEERIWTLSAYIAQQEQTEERKAILAVLSTYIKHSDETPEQKVEILVDLLVAVAMNFMKEEPGEDNSKCQALLQVALDLANDYLSGPKLAHITGKIDLVRKQENHSKSEESNSEAPDLAQIKSLVADSEKLLKATDEILRVNTAAHSGKGKDIVPAIATNLPYFSSVITEERKNRIDTKHSETVPEIFREMGVFQ